jgi:hypothetical protein
MDQKYKAAQNQAMSCENDLKNQLDDKNQDISRTLLDEARQLVSDLGGKRNPRSVEARVKYILDLLNQIKDHGEDIMDVQNTVAIRDNYEDLRRSLREFNNY